ncbi:T9SS type A sorting domain-containing protein [Plebeiobacterium sediminum]|uniref:GxGYxYP family putative glycoside hydrolase n=1 Tax=Plebeiibacterium sediminum TaxID=2992112 RepID=A0AAE3M904_9BACT|nr:T9SS type A sorting domain-containing protein [Plebeiobacterium sediminum]MCW3789216.1 GxGYxYP family putative glycoside hydrolase [Plebeiobacterium sediminum]
MKNSFIKSTRNVLFVFIYFLSFNSFYAQISWPADQILPSFSSPAQTQDLFYIRGDEGSVTPITWEAEGSSLGHNTGHLDDDGWLCQVGVDTENQYMVYGPYATNVSAGDNMAIFRIKVDNNTANNDPIVDIDVRNATTGETLASETITRQQFPTAGTYHDFLLGFNLPAAGQSIELRVYWRGGAYTKVDWVGVQEAMIWEAEGSSFGHNTGSLDGDGWLCLTASDSPQHMIYGPYAKDVPVGDNVAVFRMKVDNNTANDDDIVDIDVRNSTTGETLASTTVTRWDFPVAGEYCNFTLPFNLEEVNQKIELRVYWKGYSYTKVDWVGIQVNNNNTDELYLFASLKGIINQTQPRLFSYEGDALAEGAYTWFESLDLDWDEYSDAWDLVSKYLGEISGVIIYDPAEIHTVNLATTMAKGLNALIASPTLAAKLGAFPYNLPVLADLRGQFSSKIDVYQTLYNDYWSNTDQRLLIGLNPAEHKSALREYAVATGSAVIWLDPEISEESALLNSFLSEMPTGANFMGWWPAEEAGVSRGSEYGVGTIASDWCTNLTLHSGTSREVKVKATPPKPELQNKIYVAFILSDGDNLQYVEHLMRKLWSNSDRGSVPLGWTVSPSMLDAMPGALNYYWQTATDNDNLISGPSGISYAYPNDISEESELDDFVARTEDYTRRAGLRVVTIWNTLTGGIDQNVGETFAEYAPSILGLTSQNTSDGLTIYNNSLPGTGLACNYCWDETTMSSSISANATGWDGSEPRFIIVQCQPWQNATPTTFKNVANSLGSDYEVVRPDHFFMLMREANGLTIDPGEIHYRIKNSWKGTYLFDGGDNAAYESLPEDPGENYEWVIEEIDGVYSELRNVSTNEYLHIENLSGSIQCTSRNSGWHSSQWDLEDAGDGKVRFRNKWQSSDYIHIEDLTGNAQHGLIDTNWSSAKWILEPVTTSSLKSALLTVPSELEIVKIYPNPADDIVNIETSIENYTIDIFDITGIIVLHKNDLKGKSTINLSGLNRGIYILTINSSNEKITKRIIIE